MTLVNDNGTDGQTDGQTDRRTDRQTDRQTDRRTDRVRRIMRPPPREEGRIISRIRRRKVVNLAAVLVTCRRWKVLAVRLLSQRVGKVICISYTFNKVWRSWSMVEIAPPIE